MAFPTRQDMMGFQPPGFMGVPPPPVQVTPVLDSRAKQGALRYGARQAIGDVLIPALAGLAAGPAGALAGAAFGLSNAADRYRVSKDPLAQAQYAAELARAQAVPQVTPSATAAEIATNEYLTQNPGLAIPGRMGIPSSVQEFQYFSQLPPDQQQSYLVMKRAPPADYGAPVYDYNTGTWILPPKRAGVATADTGIQGPTSAAGVQGQATVEAAKSGAAEGAKLDAGLARTDQIADAEAITAAAGEQAKFNEAQYGAATTALSDMRKTRALLQRIRDAVEAGPETGPIEQYKALFDPDLQELRAFVESNTLASYGAARNQGVTFGSTTESEWRQIASLGASLGNSRGANLRILNNALDQVDEQIGETAGRIRRIPEGRGRMPVENPPSQRPPLSQFERPY